MLFDVPGAGRGRAACCEKRRSRRSRRSRQQRPDAAGGVSPVHGLYGIDYIPLTCCRKQSKYAHATIHHAPVQQSQETSSGKPAHRSKPTSRLLGRLLDVGAPLLPFLLPPLLLREPPLLPPPPPRLPLPLVLGGGGSAVPGFDELLERGIFPGRHA